MKPQWLFDEKQDAENLRVVFYPEETDASHAIVKMNSVLFAHMGFYIWLPLGESSTQGTVTGPSFPIKR